jgi:hypothetical protein
MKILEREYIKKEETYIKGVPHEYVHHSDLGILIPAGAKLP